MSSERAGRTRKIVRAALALCACALGAATVLTPPVFTLRGDVVRVRAYEADGQGRFVRSVGPGAARVGGDVWVSAEEVTPACHAALVAAEDVRFARHFGVDPVALRAALNRNLAQRRIAWGGSTLTQQLVKNVYLSRDASLLRKLREALGALALDRLLSKRQQIAWYLNVAEFGPRIYGIEAAARSVYGRRARELDLAQCISLFALLPDPVRSYGALASGRPDRRLELRREAALRVLADTRALPAAEIAAARAELRRANRWNRPALLLRGELLEADSRRPLAQHLGFELIAAEVHEEAVADE